MKVLVLYTLREQLLRKTIIDHLFSFKKNIKTASFHYFNALKGVPHYLTWVQYDGIILHYTLLSAKWSVEFWKQFSPLLKNLKKMKGVKIAMPQDEMVHSDLLCDFFQSHGIDTVYTCARPEDYEVLYPKEKTGLKHYFTTFTGYVDLHTLEQINGLTKKGIERDIDIGYRARDLPFWLGYFGQLKKEIAQPFLALKNAPPLKIDISTKEEDVFYGEEWIRFLLRCRTTLGCLGGASMHDPDGSIRRRVEAYVNSHPSASFEEVETHCFKGKDRTLKLFALSPRHFECAMTKTCQVLLEGDYQGAFLPGVHYIELKADYSNLHEVLNQIQDRVRCEQIAETCYQDVVCSGKYTYQRFAEEVISHIKTHTPHHAESRINTLLFHLIGMFLFFRQLLDPLVKFYHQPELLYRIFSLIVPKPLRKKLRFLKPLFGR